MWPQGTPPQNANPLTAGLFSGQGTIFGGSPVAPPPDFDIASAFGMQGASSMAVNMAIQPLIQSYLGSNYVPGRMTPGVNPYEQMVRRSQLAEQQAVGKFGNEIDQKTFIQYMKSMALMTGKEFGEKEQLEAKKMAADIGKISPIIAGIAPDFYDQLLGARGSADLLGKQIVAGGRYATDPVTRGRGLSGDTSRKYTEEIYEQLYGDNADIKKMRGVGAGQAGIIYDELQRRGLAVTPLAREEATAQIAKDAKTTVEEAIKLPDFGDKLRKFEAGRAAQQLKEMSASVGAMRELFGDAGRPDAPMSELINALQALTQGGMGNMSPKELERIVRQTGNAAKQAGTDIRGVLQLTSTLTPVTDSLGLSRDAALQSSIGGLAFADDYGRSLGNVKLPGTIDKEQAAVLGGNLNAGGINSQQMQRLAAVRRAVEEFGIDGEADTDFGRLYRAAFKDKKTTYKGKDGIERSVFIDSGIEGANTLTQVAARSGVRTDLVQELSADKAGNYRYTKEIFADLGDRAQFEDVRYKASRSFELQVGRVGDKDITEGMTDAEREKTQIDNVKRREELSGLGSAVGVRAFDEFTLEQRAGLFDQKDDARRNRSQADLRKIFDEEAVKRKIVLSDEEKKRLDTQLRLIPKQLNQDLDRELGPLYGPTGYRGQNAMLVFSPDRLQGRQDSRDEAAVKAEVQEKFADLSQGPALRRTAEALRTAGPGTTVESVMAAAAGYLPRAAVEQMGKGEYGRITKLIQDQENLDVGGLRAKIKELKTKDTPAAKEELKKIESRYGKPADELLDPKMSESSIRTTGLRNVLGEIDRAMPAMRKEMEEINRLAAKPEEELKLKTFDDFIEEQILPDKPGKEVVPAPQKAKSRERHTKAFDDLIKTQMLPEEPGDKVDPTKPRKVEERTERSERKAVPTTLTATDGPGLTEAVIKQPIVISGKIKVDLKTGDGEIIGTGGMGRI